MTCLNTSSFFAEFSVNEYNNVLCFDFSENHRSILGKKSSSVASHFAAKGDRNKVEECKRCNVLSLQLDPKESFCCLMGEWNAWNAWVANYSRNAKCNDSIFVIALHKERDIYIYIDNIYRLDSLILMRTVMLICTCTAMFWFLHGTLDPSAGGWKPWHSPWWASQPASPRYRVLRV